MMPMRGPLLSGPVGSAVTLRRVCEIARDRAPAAVLSALWLAERLAAEVAVAAFVEPTKRGGARRVVRRAARRQRRLMVVTAAEDLPVAPRSVGCIVVESLAEIEDDGQAADFLARLAPALRVGGVVLCLDGTKNPAVEARMAGLFIAAALTGIVQERPREGALLTIGAAAAPAVIEARLAAPAE
jgi:predicted O-methyltransferase YrrM